MVKMFIVTALVAAAAPVDAGQSAAHQLRAQLEMASGGPVRIDPRIAIPPCAEPWSTVARAGAYDVHCASSGWRMVVPTGAPASAADGRAPGPVRVRRGESVVVEAGGPGFRIRADGIAEQDSRAGDLVRVRNLRTGARIQARLAEDGRLRMATP